MTEPVTADALVKQVRCDLIPSLREMTAAAYAADPVAPEGIKVSAETPANIADTLEMLCAALSRLSPVRDQEADALEPCPLCGGEAELQHEQGMNAKSWQVCCLECGARTGKAWGAVSGPAPDAYAKTQVATIWNSRISPVRAPEACVEAVARALCIATGDNPDRLCRDTHGELVPNWVTFNPLARAAIAALPAHGDELREALVAFGDTDDFEELADQVHDGRLSLFGFWKACLKKALARTDEQDKVI